MLLSTMFYMSGPITALVAALTIASLPTRCIGKPQGFAPRPNADGRFEDCGGISLKRQLDDVVTWQSSAMHGTCLWHRRQSEGGGSYWFHTGYSPSYIGADSYHWLAVRLPATILMEKITARYEVRHLLNLPVNGGYFNSSPVADVFTEVLVSAQEVDFGDEHCRAPTNAGAASVLRSVADEAAWKLCTRLLPPRRSLTDEYSCQDDGGVLVRTLLVRKRVQPSSRFMSFADLILRQAFYVSARPAAVVQGEPLTVQCSSCGGRGSAPSPTQMLCLTSGANAGYNQLCVSRRLVVPSAEPQHAGSYVCRHPRLNFSAAATVRVLYAPADLRIDYRIQRTVTDESSSHSAAEAQQRKLVAGLEIRFASSNAYPPPQHRCVAQAGRRSVPLLKSLTRWTSDRGAKESAWLASLADGQVLRLMTESGVTVKCAATQSFDSGRTGDGLYRGSVGFHRLIRLQPDSAGNTTLARKDEFEALFGATVALSTTAPILLLLLIVTVIALVWVIVAKRRASESRHRVVTVCSQPDSRGESVSLPVQAPYRQNGMSEVPSETTALSLPLFVQQPSSTASGIYDEPVVYIN